MIKFKNLSNEAPFKIFKKKYDDALLAGQRNIEAICISSFDMMSNTVDSRYVNIKYLDNNIFIFFTNYKSPKSLAFKSHNQISGLFYWSSTNTQIRIKAKIKKTTKEFNKLYFNKRSINKNLLAISSNQSQPISSYDEVIKKYNLLKDKNDIVECPDYWGGYFFSPYEIEFWVGHENRLNKRDLYIKKNKNWIHSILEP